MSHIAERNGHPPAETAKARAAYYDYELMGPERSLRKMAEVDRKYTKRMPLLKRWSAAHHWQDRVRAYDEEQARIRQKKRQAELDKMDEEHALIGRTLLLRAIALINRHIEEGDTSLSFAIQLMKVAYTLERLARGAATERLDSDVSVTILPKEYINFDPDQDGVDS